MRNELERGMSSSENPPATKCHKNCHKRDALSSPRKAKGPCGKRFCHTGRLVSGEGGIRTRGTVTRTQHFQCCTIDHSVTSPWAPPDTQYRPKVRLFAQHSEPEPQRQRTA